MCTAVELYRAVGQGQGLASIQCREPRTGQQRFNSTTKTTKKENYLFIFMYLRKAGLAWPLAPAPSSAPPPCCRRGGGSTWPLSPPCSSSPPPSSSSPPPSLFSPLCCRHRLLFYSSPCRSWPLGRSVGGGGQRSHACPPACRPGGGQRCFESL